MSKKRGLSLEEKRQGLLELFYEKKDFFQLKDLEKMAPKEKKITTQSVKPVLQSLVDDNLVRSERIGTSNYFWAFPSEAVNVRKRKIAELEAKREQLVRKKAVLTGQVSEMQKGREETSERVEVLDLLNKKKLENVSLKKELDQYRQCDPQVLKKLKADTVTAIDAANRWTENVFTMKSWCKNQFGIEENIMDQQFGIPEDLDFI